MHAQDGAHDFSHLKNLPKSLLLVFCNLLFYTCDGL